MQMKIGRWQGLYPRIQSAAKHIRCGFVCGYRKIADPFGSERSAIIGVPLNRVYTVATSSCCPQCAAVMSIRLVEPDLKDPLKRLKPPARSMSTGNGEQIINPGSLRRSPPDRNPPASVGV